RTNNCRPVSPVRPTYTSVCPSGDSAARPVGAFAGFDTSTRSGNGSGWGVTDRVATANTMSAATARPATSHGRTTTLLARRELAVTGPVAPWLAGASSLVPT